MPIPHPWLLWSHCVTPQGQHQCSPKRRVTDLSRLAQACLILKLKDLCPGPWDSWPPHLQSALGLSGWLNEAAFHSMSRMRGWQGLVVTIRVPSSPVTHVQALSGDKTVALREVWPSLACQRAAPQGHGEYLGPVGGLHVAGSEGKDCLGPELADSPGGSRPLSSGSTCPRA